MGSWYFKNDKYYVRTRKRRKDALNKKDPIRRIEHPYSLAPNANTHHFCQMKSRLALKGDRIHYNINLQDKTAGIYSNFTAAKQGLDIAQQVTVPFGRRIVKLSFQETSPWFIVPSSNVNKTTVKNIPNSLGTKIIGGESEKSDLNEGSKEPKNNLKSLEDLESELNKEKTHSKIFPKEKFNVVQDTLLKEREKVQKKEVHPWEDLNQILNNQLKIIPKVTQPQKEISGDVRSLRSFLLFCESQIVQMENKVLDNTITVPEDMQNETTPVSLPQIVQLEDKSNNDVPPFQESQNDATIPLTRDLYKSNLEEKIMNYCKDSLKESLSQHSDVNATKKIGNKNIKVQGKPKPSSHQKQLELLEEKRKEIIDKETFFDKLSKARIEETIEDYLLKKKQYPEVLLRKTDFTIDKNKEPKSVRNKQIIPARCTIGRPKILKKPWENPPKMLSIKSYQQASTLENSTKHKERIQKGMSKEKNKDTLLSEKIRQEMSTNCVNKQMAPGSEILIPQKINPIVPNACKPLYEICTINQEKKFLYIQCQFCLFKHMKLIVLAHHYFLKHLNVHVSEDNLCIRLNPAGHVSCGFCYIVLISRLAFKLHCIKKHFELLFPVDNYICCFCHSKFPNLIRLIQHYRTSHKRFFELITYSCMYCSKLFSTEKDIVNHFFTEHQDSQKKCFSACIHCLGLTKPLTEFQIHYLKFHLNSNNEITTQDGNVNIVVKRNGNQSIRQNKRKIEQHALDTTEIENMDVLMTSELDINVVGDDIKNESEYFALEVKEELEHFERIGERKDSEMNEKLEIEFVDVNVDKGY